VAKIQEQEAQLMLTTGAMRLPISRSQQARYHFGSVATYRALFDLPQIVQCDVHFLFVMLRVRWYVRGVNTMNIIVSQFMGRF